MGRTTAAHARMRGVARSKAAEGCGGQAPPQTSVDEEAATPGPLNVYTLCAVAGPPTPPGCSLSCIGPEAFGARFGARVCVCVCVPCCRAQDRPRTPRPLRFPLNYPG